MTASLTHPWAEGAGATHTGGRPYNEDAFLSRFPVFVVSDGMGGHIAGAAASQAVVAAFEPLCGRQPVTPEDVVAAVADAHQGVEDISEAEGSSAGATLTGVIAVEHDGHPWWMVINVGDSRVYQLEGGALEQITDDHSRVQELVDQGSITQEQALVHPERNIITRAMGDGTVDSDVWLTRVRPGVRLVIASDGLMKELDDRQIAAITSLSGSPTDAANRLVEAALGAGTVAGDNVTVVVADAHSVVTPAEASSVPWPQWPDNGEALEENTVTSKRRRSDA